jgi:hypothetical protein
MSHPFQKNAIADRIATSMSFDATRYAKILLIAGLGSWQRPERVTTNDSGIDRLDNSREKRKKSANNSSIMVAYHALGECFRGVHHDIERLAHL